MFTPQEVENLIFLDIETVPATDQYQSLSPVLQKHWERKIKRIDPTNEDPASAYDTRAGVFAEYSKIVCVSCGYIRFQDQLPVPTFKTMFHTEEKELLKETYELFGKIYGQSKSRRLCGHNLREFDLPFLGRRMLVHRMLPLPEPLQVFGKKPWEIVHVDTMDLFRFGDHKTFTSLEVMTDLFGIDSPKSTMNGADVAKAYWNDHRYEEIQRYCEDDVQATMQLVLYVSGLPLLPAAN